jgi:hypothetical protein
MTREFFDQLVALIGRRETGAADLLERNTELADPYSSLDALLNDFAQFVAEAYLRGDLSYLDANAARNRMYPTANFQVPEPFFDVYLAFEDSECDEAPDETARPRVKEVHNARFAV